MMNQEKRIEVLMELKEFLSSRSAELNEEVEKAYQHNKWFTPDNIFLAIKNINEQFLDVEKLRRWLSNYKVQNDSSSKTVGIVMAGNIPLVGFHDFLCVFLSGNKSMVKLSSKDNVLFPVVMKKLFEADENMKHEIVVTEILKGMDAVIATGSNNSSRYFEQYFGKYPHIIRKNRSSVAVLSGDETGNELKQLGFDIFSFLGLGCRNVSKFLVPSGYSFDVFFQSLEPYIHVHEHNKYQNNYDYNRALLLLNRTEHLANDFLILKQDKTVSSPVSVLHYEFYKDENELNEILKRDAQSIQCVVGRKFIPFGESQSPQLDEYADGVDTMKFLCDLN